MSQLLKKFALLTACAALAFCFTTRPASAQMVEPGGTGEHLFFTYWSADKYTNTNVNIHSPLGMYGADDPAKNAVYVRIRSAAPDRNIVASFNICLNPGDSWTARLSMDGLMVMDEGECDGDLRELGSNPSNMNVATPTMDGDPVSLGGTESGYIEAWLNPVNALKDGADEGFNPDNATPRFISGTAMLVSPMSGFSSSYNAVALSGCGNVTTAPTAAGAGSTIYDSLGIGGTADNDNDDGNGCWHVLVAGDPPANPADNVEGSPISLALMAQDRDVLTGRWTALNNDDVMSHTKVVLTFPVPHLGVSDGTSDPLTIHIYDDMGNIVHRGTDLTLPMGVNMCMFGDGMMDMDMMPMLSCNDEDVAELDDAMSGEFRILNNKAISAPDREGGERGGLGTEDADTNADGTQSAQHPAESLNAIGLVFSYFMGTDGMQYDQATPIQWVNIDMDGTGDDTGTNP